MKAIVIGCEKYYRRTFSNILQKQMVFYDHIGFREDDTGICSLELILKEINLLQDSLLLDKVMIVGHSIHAYMAAEYAKIYPDKVARVILIGSGPYTDIQAANSYFNEYADSKRKDDLEQNLTLPFGYFSNDPFIDRILRFAPMLWYNYNYDAATL